MSACLYHSNKCGFDNVTRDIQRSKILPTPHSKRLAMCVCSCRMKRFNMSNETTQEELQNMAAFLDRCTQTENWPVSLNNLLRSELNDVCLDKYSACVLTVVLYRAVKHKHYGLLESLMRKKQNTPKKGVPDRMTSVQFNYMINKKWKNSTYKIELIVPLFAGNLKKFENDERIKQLRNEHKDVVLRICHTENGQYMEQNMKKMKIKLGGKDEHEVKRVGQEMIKIGGCIQKELDMKRMLEYGRRKRQWNRSHIITDNYGNDNLEGNLTQISLDHKSSLEDFYTRRVESNRISGKPKSNPLKDGHCINCLDIFSSLKDAGECVYHPGFIGRDNKWTCCDKETSVDHPTYQVHTDTGCSTGIHNWRHGKDLKKTRKHRSKLSPNEGNSSMDWIIS